MSDERREYVGWFLICETKIQGTDEGKVCSKSEDHRLSNKGKFCPECGSKVEKKKIPHRTSFTDVYERESYLTEELCGELEVDFWHVPIDSEALVGDDMEILIPSIDDLFDLELDASDGEGIYTTDPETIRVDFDRQEKLIKTTIKSLKPIYSNIDVHFGKLVYWI